MFEIGITVRQGDGFDILPSRELDGSFRRVIIGVAGDPNRVQLVVFGNGYHEPGASRSVVMPTERLINVKAYITSEIPFVMRPTYAKADFSHELTGEGANRVEFIGRRKSLVMIRRNFFGQAKREIFVHQFR
jgi:hypothetical protein